MNDDSLKWGWKENPFVLKIDPNLFVGYDEQIDAILNHIKNKHKIGLITGKTGAGKSTFLKWLEINYNEPVLYISKPPENPEDFIKIFTNKFGFSIWERLLRRRPSLYTLPKYINKKLEENHLMLLIDEAHETNKEVLEWLRVLTDQIDNVSLIIAGMPILEHEIRSKLETFNQRIITRINLTALDKDETKELIEKRIENVGGKGTKPFTDFAIEKIFERTGGFPREVLKFCDRLVNSALKKELDIINVRHIKEHKEIELPKTKLEEPKVTFMPKPPTEEKLNNLSYKQRKIVELLSNKNWLTPTSIVEEMEIKDQYKTKGHAIRSVNNILKRLLSEGCVQREARGKAFIYALTPKVRTMFVER